MSRIVNATVLRVSLASLALIGGLFISPVFAAIPMFFLALLWRSSEALVIALILDLIWAPPGQAPYFLIGTIISVWVFEPVRKEILP